MTILVTGGAGYIGAHVVRLLQERDQQVVVVDDLSTGSPGRIGNAELVELDVAGPGAQEVLETTMRKHQVSAVIHFAARKQVGESVQRPTYYYQQNIGGLANVLAAMEAAAVDTLVFSSSAATYGVPTVDVVTESLRAEPINPYGETKLIGEWMGRDAARAWGLRFVGLRYFNVAGAGWDDLGDPAILNLIPMVLDRVERGQRPAIFGEDYPTPDGTCVRDYVHVLDL
ncbi:MAG: NAD-dependent epimerase/dehydratase family protein, partial [Cellulomonadaceae bacterium]